MKKILVAFDIDGTLRCNCTENCRDENWRIAKLVEILGSFKNVTLMAWSGGGKDYTWQFIREHGMDGYIPHSRCYSKLDAPKPDIAIDDQQAFSLGNINLIVREK